VTIAKRPLLGTGRRGLCSDLRWRETEMFLQTGLDGANQPDAIEEFSFCAQASGTQQTSITC
jgi:hypothetical protein